MSSRKSSHKTKNKLISARRIISSPAIIQRLFYFIFIIIYLESSIYPIQLLGILHGKVSVTPKDSIVLWVKADEQQLHPTTSSSSSSPLSSSSFSSTTTPTVCDTSKTRNDNNNVDVTVVSSQSIPKPLEYSIDFDLPSISYSKLRHEMLSDQSDFWIDTIMSKALQYTQIERSSWDKYSKDIGAMTAYYQQQQQQQPYTNFIGAIRKTQYRMPKSLFVPYSIMAYETCTLEEYNDDYFVLQRITTTPDAPFGTSYRAKTQVVVMKSTKFFENSYTPKKEKEEEESCSMICSVETEFIKNPPLGMSWPIRKGMRDGTLDGFKMIAQTILNSF